MVSKLGISFSRYLFSGAMLVSGSVSKNNGTPKWMVKIMEHPIKMDDLGGNTPYFWFNTHIYIYINNINHEGLFSGEWMTHQGPHPKSKESKVVSGGGW